MQADRTQVEEGGMFRLQIRVHVVGGSADGLELPDLSAFDVVSRQRPPRVGFGGMGLGGLRGGAQHMEVRTSESLVLRARQEGTYELEPATLTLGGRTFRSNAVTITVGRGGPGGARPDPGADPQAAPDPATQLPPGDQRDGMQFDPNGFVRTWVDHGEPYLGQQVTVTIYLYTRQPLRGSPTITQEPSTEGFWTRDLLPPSRTLSRQQQTMGGQRFHVYVLRRFAAFPLQTGELTIGPTTITVTQGGGLFGLFGGGRPSEPLTRTGVPVTVDVGELPTEGRPDATGEVHVGRLELSAEIDRSQVATGDAVTLTVTAEGRGPIEQVRVPSPEGDGLRVLQPEIRDEVTTPNDVVGGTRTYRWLIVPERAGEYTLGPFEVPVFDPIDETYTVARAEALTLTAAGAAVDAPADDAPEETGEPSPEAAERDALERLGPIRTRSALTRRQTAIAEQPWFLALLALGPLAFLGALGFRGARRRAARPDPSRAPKRARRAAKKRLSAARRHADADEPRAFYAAVANALKEVLEAKLGHAVGSLTYPELRRELEDRGLDAEAASGVVDELEGCDFARFSAVGVSREEMERCLDRTRGLLATLHRFTPRAEEAS
ncbi:MAG TPA: BatD family protein [Sandaracinaceae bacterium LLY-WYZ-13_1]|nr:BatD family protein [Sandaracinaceae bacterium LLY-WYZ-13_1]